MFGRSAKPIRIRVFAKTDVGRTRDHNEDSFLVADLTRRSAELDGRLREHELGERGSLFVVADGMGGAAAGEMASAMATATIFDHLTGAWLGDRDVTPQRFAYRLKEAVESANAKIHAYAKEHPEVRGMGTTTTAAGVFGDHVYLTQVGDSRAYIVRDGQAIQVTKDQSLMQRLVDAGELTEEEAAASERRNIILQALGPEPKVKVDLTHQELRRGDALLICCDGLSNLVKKEEMAEIVTGEAAPERACERLIALANERGGNDNITVIVARVDGDGLRNSGEAQTLGHHVFPLTDTESSTEPVPVYKGSKAPVPARRARWRRAAWAGLGFVVVAAAVWLVLRAR